MPDMPPEAIQAGAEALQQYVHGFGDWEDRARAVLAAAAPVLAEALLTPLAKRHAMIPSEWGGGFCGICWTKGGSRAAWPCGEILAIAAILPVSTEADSEVPRDVREDEGL